MMQEMNYALLKTDEEMPGNRGGWQEYPGQKRQGESPAKGPPAGSVFVKTGGNALQAIDRAVLEQESVVRVIVPEGKGPGDTILVRCPYTKERIIPTIIPETAKEGTEFLVRIPPLNESNAVTNSEAVIVGLHLGEKIAAKSAILSTAAAGLMLV